MSSAILDKPGKLTNAEWSAMRRHPEWSLQILQRIPAFLELAHIAAAHHERLDGSGYYRGLRGEHLDRPARILAVADVAEALSSDRPYREALGPDEVLGIMRRDAGTALDAEAFAALEELLPAWSARAAAGARRARRSRRSYRAQLGSTSHASMRRCLSTARTRSVGPSGCGRAEVAAAQRAGRVELADEPAVGVLGAAGQLEPGRRGAGRVVAEQARAAAA